MNAKRGIIVALAVLLLAALVVPAFAGGTGKRTS